MDPFGTVEDILCDVGSWLTYLINDVFFEDPNSILVENCGFYVRQSCSYHKAVDCFITRIELDSY